jgi:hypothetical protein
MARHGLCITIFLCGVLLNGCASYKAVPLSRLEPEFAPFSETKEGVTLACKAFTKTDCKRHFDRDVIKKGYQPVQVSINNDTKRYLLFSAQGVSLPVVSGDEVAKKVHTSTAGRSTAYGVGALILWPLAVPAIVDGVGSSKANQQLDTDFAAKGAQRQVIQPYGTMNGILFVPTADFREEFTITVVDKETKEKITFNARAPRL